MIRDELNKAQQILQDAESIGLDGSIWSRAELLDWFREGYRLLLAETAPTRRFTVLPVPPRFTWAVSHPWMLEYVQDAPAIVWAHQGEGGWAASHPWMLQQVEGIAPVAGGEWAMSQPWMMTYQNPVDHHFRFALPRDNGRVVTMWHNHRLLLPIAVRGLDSTETHWYSLGGEPMAWTMGVGMNRTVEIFEIATGYIADYLQVDALTNDANPQFGIPRRFSGARTYEWESASGDSVPYGIPRRIMSPDRQYYPRVDEPLDMPIGKPCWYASSVDNLLVLETRIPDDVTLMEDDPIALLPPQMGKYLRWYTLARAFSRQGPGLDPAMSAFYAIRFQRGLTFLHRLHQLARKDRPVSRPPVEWGRSRPPRVRLPSSYPEVWR